MPRQVFVDASAWVAISDEGETRHREAVETYTELLDAPAVLITTCLAVAEAQILLRRRLGHQAAITFLESVNESPRVEIEYANDRLETEAQDILRQYDDQDFSFTDAVSFALMRRRGLTEAFAFDQHFVTAGFIVLPPDQ